MTGKKLILNGFILLQLLIFSNVFSQDHWAIVYSPVNSNLKNCFFINNNTGWISGASGTIIRTTNEGLDWSIQNSGIHSDIQSIYFINERLGWAIAYEVSPDTNSFYGTRILKTTNGGDNWASYMYPDTNKFMRTIYFLDSLTGFMVGAPIDIVRTGNAGSTWERMDTDSSLQLGMPVENIKFINSQTGYACGGFRDIAGAMWTTTDGGFNWRGVIVAPEPFMDLYIFDPYNAIAVGGDFEFGSSYVRSTDQGLVWQYDTLGTFGVATSVDFRTQNEGWITLGIAQKFAFTRDRGNRWSSVFTPDSIPLNDLQFTDSLHGWAVGLYGTIMKYVPVPTGIYNTINNQNLFSESYILHQNYPNPFNPETIINYELAIRNFVTLKVYDLLGNEVATLINETKPAGIYNYQFSTVNYELASGIYFYSLFIDGILKETRRMILLK